MFVACPRQRGRGACRLLLSCAVTLLHPAIASAVEPRDVAAPAVVVTATRTEQRIIDAPGAISVVQKAEIDRRNILTLDQAVSTVPGLFAKRSKGILDTLGGIQMRGVPDDNRSLLLLDGLPMNDGYTGGVRLGGISTTDISRIEVLRGPGSSLYGGNAMGGVVQVVTKMPTGPVAELKMGLGAPVSSDFGMEEFRSTAVRLGNRYESGLSLLAAYTSRSTDGYRSDLVTSTATPPGTVSGAVSAVTPQGASTRIMGERGANRWEDYDANLTARYEMNASNALQLRFKRTFYEYGYGEPLTYLRDATGAPVYNFTNGASVLRQSSFAAGGGQNMRDILQATYEASLAGGDLRVQIAQIDTGLNRFSTPDTTAATLAGGAGKISNTPSVTRLIDGQWTRSLTARHVLTTGGSVRWDKADVQEQAITDWRIFDSATGPFLYEARGKALTVSAFGQDQWTVTESLTAYLGLRWDRWKASDGYAQDLNPTTLVPRPGFPKSFPERTDSALSPKLGLVWQAAENVTVRASAGTAFRAPTMYDLYRTWVSSAGTIFRANPDLTPETIRTVDAGVEVRPWDGGKVALNVFHNAMKDLIYRRTVTTLAEAQSLCGPTATVTNCRHFVNAGRARSQGIELELAHTTGAWQWFANTTYIESKVQENAFAPASVGKRITNVPQWLANAGATYTSGGLGATLVARYVGKTYRDDSNADTISGVYQSQDPRTIVDFKTSWRFHRHAAVALAIDNLFDRQYFDFYRGVGRTAFAELTLNY